MRQRHFLFGLILLTLAFTLSCGGPSPDSVTRQFLDAMKNGKWEDAGKLVDSGSVPSSLSSLQAQTAAKDDTGERLGKLLFSKMSYELGETKTEGDSATVKAKIRSVDLKGILGKYISENIPLALAEAFSGAKPEDVAPDANKYLEDAIANPQAPMVTNDVNIKLERRSSNQAAFS